MDDSMERLDSPFMDDSRERLDSPFFDACMEKGATDENKAYQACLTLLCPFAYKCIPVNIHLGKAKYV